MAHDDDMMTPGDDASEEFVPTWTTDGHLDEGTIHAWLDDAFDSAQAAVIAAHVDGCANCRESVAEARGFIAGASRMVRALDAVPSGVVPEEDVARVASRIVAAAAVTDATRTDEAPQRARRAWYTQPVMRAAAAVMVMVAGGTYVWSRMPVTPTTDARANTERSAASSAPLIEAPKSVAASELSAPPAPTMRPAPATTNRAARKDVATRGAAARVPERMPAIANQKLEDRPAAALARVGERREVTADALAPAAPPRAVSDTGTRVLTGRITTSSGAPAANVQLSASGLGKTGTITDSSGAYRLRVAGDSVVLLARQLGFAPQTQVVDLRSRDSARVDMQMQAIPLQLNAVVVTGARAGASERVSIGAATSIQGKSSARVTATCWSVRASGVSAIPLPSHLSAPSLDEAGLIRTQWINWPSIGRTTSVEMSSDAAGGLTGSSAVSGETLVLTLRLRGDDWAGLAVRRRGAAHVEQPIVLTSAVGSVCKM